MPLAVVEETAGGIQTDRRQGSGRVSQHVVGIGVAAGDEHLRQFIDYPVGDRDPRDDSEATEAGWAGGDVAQQQSEPEEGTEVQHFIVHFGTDARYDGKMSPGEDRGPIQGQDEDGKPDSENADFGDRLHQRKPDQVGCGCRHGSSPFASPPRSGVIVNSRIRLVSVGVLSAGICLIAFPIDSTSQAEDATRGADEEGWKPLQEKWEVCNFGGDGPVKIDPSLIRLGYGDPLTGIRWAGEFPRDSYEIRLEARRTDGHDFFCGLTFPVGEGKCSLILGGWGGGVLGLSSIDGEDASSNETTQFKVFDNDQWYKVKIRVTPEKIVCTIDDKTWVEQDRGNHEFDVRLEMDPTVPLGIANFQCQSEFRGLQWRKLTPEGKPENGEQGQQPGPAAEPVPAEVPASDGQREDS